MNVSSNFPDIKFETLQATNNPEKPSEGKRDILFTKEIYIERSDFIENWINEKATPRDRYIDKWARDTFEPDPYENSPVMDSFPDMADY